MAAVRHSGTSSFILSLRETFAPREARAARPGFVSLGLYMDVHVPLPVTRGMRRCGVDVLTAQEDNTQRLPDSQLLDRATGLGRLLFSEDLDLVVKAVRR